MNETEFAIIKVSIQISKTQLTVRFPCSLQYTLKSESNTIQSDKLYELKNGLSQHNQNLQLELQVQMNNEEYHNAKVFIGVLMVSANGKFPAGSVTVLIADQGELIQAKEQQVKSIDKCPDKLAKIYYQLKIEAMSRVKRPSATPKLNSSSKSSHQSASYLHHKKHSRESSKYPQKQYESSTNIPRQNNETSRFSAIQLKQAMIGKYSKTETNFLQSTNKKNGSKGKGQDQSENSENGSSYVRKWDSNEKSRNSSNSKNYSDHRFYTMKNEEDYSQVRYKLDLKQASNQLIQMKQKYRQLERKQREQKQQIKQLKDQIERNKNKIANLQMQGTEHKMQISDKERGISQLQDDLRRLKESIDEQKRNSNFQQKRIEYKENTLNQQFKKINEKYQQSEHERLKIIKQMNEKLNEFENTQQKSLLHFRQKEKGFVEEKNKLTKKIQNLLYEVTCLKQGNSNLKSQLEELKSSQKNTNKTRTETQNQLTNINLRYQAVAADLKKKEAQLTVHIAQNKELKAHNQRLLVIEHKYHEISLQNVVFKQSDIKSQKKVESLTKVQMDLQNRLNDVLNSKQSFMSKNTELLKELQIIRKANQQKDYQICQLKQSNSSIMDRVQELKIRLNGQKQILQQDHKKMQDELKLAYKIKQSLNHDYDDTKWKLERAEESLENYRSKIVECNQKNLKDEKEIISKNERIKYLIESNKEYELRIKILSSQLQSKQKKQKQLIDEIKVYNKQINNSHNIIKQKQIQIQILLEKQVILNNVNRQYKNGMEDIGGERLREREEYQKRIQQYQRLCRQNNRQRQRMMRQLQRYQQQNNNINNNNKQIQMKLMQMQNDGNGKDCKIKQLERQNQVCFNKMEEQIKVRQKKQQQLMLIKKSFENYKQQFRNSMEKFIQQLCKNIDNDNDISTFEIMKISNNFNDEHILKLQIQAIRQKTQRHVKNRQQIKKIEWQNKQLRLQLTKYKNMIIQIQQQRQKNIKQLKQQYNNNIYKIKQQNNNNNNIMEYVEKIKGYQKQKQSYVVDCAKFKNQIQQYLVTIQQVNKQKQQLKLQKQSLQSVIIQLERKNDKLKKSLQNLQEFKQYQIIINKYKNNIKQQQKKILRLEQKLLQMNKNYVQIQFQLQQKNGAVDKLERKGLELENSLFEEINKNKNKESVIENLSKKQMALENKNKEYFKQINQKQKSIKQLHKQLGNQKQSNEINQNKIKQLQQQIEYLLRQKQQLINNLNKQKQIFKLNKNQYSQQSKLLSSNIINLQSDLEIKKFIIQQLQNNFAQLKSNQNQILKQLQNKKKQINSLNIEMSQLNNDKLSYKSTISELESTNEQLYQQIDNYKVKILSLQHENIDNFMKENLIQEKEKEIQKMTNDMLSLEDKYHGVRKELKSVTTQFTNQCLLRKSNEEQLSLKIQKLEKELSNKRYHHSNENQKQMESLSIERNEILSDLESVEIQNDRLNSILENLKEQYQKQLQSLNQQCAEMAGLLAQKQELLNTRNEKIVECESKIKILTNEFKICMQTWQNEKKQQEQLKLKKNETHFSKIVNEVNSRSMNLLNNFSVSTTFN